MGEVVEMGKGQRHLDGAGRSAVLRVQQPEPVGESLEAARRVLLGLGGAATVLEPESLRDSMRDYAEQVLSAYQR